MHDTCAPEAAHKTNIKLAMDRVRKGEELETACSMISWVFTTSTWARIIEEVEREYIQQRKQRRTARKPFTPQKKKRKSTNKKKLQVIVNRAKIHEPTKGVRHLFHTDTFSPLREGGDNLMTPDVRVSYHELGSLIVKTFRWSESHVRDNLHVRLYCSARVIFPSGATRTYWSTESRYPYLGGSRRDMVEIDLGKGNVGVAQLVSFIQMDNLPSSSKVQRIHAVLIRWMDVPSLSPKESRDSCNRPMCQYPLSSNHCLWEWSSTPRNRASFGVRGFRRIVRNEGMWSHVPEEHRQRAIDSEIRARYDILPYISIIDHANISLDPTTGLMLQTLQMI